MKIIQTLIGQFEASKLALKFNELSFYERLEALSTFSIPVYKENKENLIIKIRVNKKLETAYVEAKDGRGNGQYFFCDYPFKQNKPGDKYVKLYKKDLKGFIPKVGGYYVVTKSPHKFLRKGSLFKVEEVIPETNKVMFTIKRTFRHDLRYGFYRPAVKEEEAFYEKMLDFAPHQEINIRSLYAKPEGEPYKSKVFVRLRSLEKMLEKTV